MCDDFTKGIVVLTAAIMSLSILSAVTAQENNSTILNNTILSNTTLNNTTLNITNSTVTGSTAISSTITSELGQSSALPESASGQSAFQIGKGLNEDVINASRLDDNASFQINHGNVESPLQIGQPEKPVRDLEKVVFICNIV